MTSFSRPRPPLSTLSILTLGLCLLGPAACTEAEPAPEADATLAPADLVGEWRSGECEAYPDGMGGMNYLQRNFTLDESEWHLDLDLYGDPECSFALFSAEISGPYALLGESEAVPGATEGNFDFASIVWTAHFEDMATLFTDSGCGSAPWVVGEPQDVSATGCIGVAHPISECATDHDIVSIDGDELFFGERVTDMCEVAGRPTALNTYPVIRQ